MVLIVRAEHERPSPPPPNLSLSTRHKNCAPRYQQKHVQMVGKVADEMDDDMQKIDQATLDGVKVTISPAMSPKGEELHRGVHVA